MSSSLHAKTRTNRSGFVLKTVSAAVVSAWLLSNAHAAGLGRLTVLSSLGQPLVAEVELTSVSKDEAGALSAKLASLEAFKNANIEYNAALGSLRFDVEQRSGRHIIRVTSTQPLNEPFVDMLVELSGPNGRLLREYTFLLDPVDLRAAQPPQVVAPAPATPRASNQSNNAAAPSVSPPPQRSQTNPTATRPGLAASQSGRAEDGGTTVRVERGDTLAQIAGQVRPEGISLDQMLVALYQANPEAFVGNNMNRLRAGKILTVPSAETAGNVSASEARRVVVAQAADFNAYRTRLADRIASSEAQQDGGSRQNATGSITARVEEKTAPAGVSGDKLKLSNPTAAPNGNATQNSAAGLTLEDKIAAEKALAEANARIKELENNVSDLQKLLELKNKNLAAQQAQPAQQPEPTSNGAATAPAQTSDSGSANRTPDQAAAPAASEAAKPAEPVEAAAPTPKPIPAKPKQTPPPVPVSEPSFFDELSSNPLVLPGLGALLVALGALGIFSARRNKQRKRFEDSIITDSSLRANSLFGSTGGQSVDTNNSVFNSSFSPSSSSLDSNEVDPVAEADVYIAYGRDAQAEEILKEALRTQPGRHAVRVKLLEIYSNRKDLRAFEVLATELYGLTRGEGEDWAQAAALGIALDPNNPLYAGGKSSSNAGTLDAGLAPEKSLETLLAETHLDTTPEAASPLETGNAYFSTTALVDEAPAMPIETAPAPPPSEDKPEGTRADADVNALDFNLDGLSFREPGEEEAAKTEAEALTPAPLPAEELNSIDFNFLDEPSAKVEQEAEKPLNPEALFSLEPDTAQQEHGESVEPELKLDDLSLASALDSAPEIALQDDVPPLTAEEQEAAEPIELRLPEQGEPLAPAEKPEPVDFDLSAISLELESAPETAKPAAEMSLDNEFDLPPLDTETTFGDAEMDTKLDLAIAYREIGDKEGARELLDEVLKGGTPEQSERAKSLLLELA